jgi:Nucleotidyltransferase/DNA polymerase involved in DNA repair
MVFYVQDCSVRPVGEENAVSSRFPAASQGRTVVHVDMDAFFASIEALLHPEYRGKPLIVGADPRSNRGVVSTCSYEARAYGVRSAMPIREAYRRCPHAIFVRPDMPTYVAYSRKVREVLDRFTPIVEPLSIDEAFLDMTGCEHFYPSLHEMGKAIKEAIREATGLIASVGIAPNKFLAKLASDLGKPDGLVVVSPQDVQSFLDPLPVQRLWGVGAKGAARLIAQGITTIGELRQRSLPWLQRELGHSLGQHLYRLARGIDERPVEPVSEAQSMSREITFDTDVQDPSLLRSVLAKLVADVGRRLRKEGLFAHTVTLKLRYPDYTTITRQKRSQLPFCDDDRIFALAIRLLESINVSRPVRLIGVGVTDFVEAKQASLFEDDSRAEAISRVMDAVNAKGSGRLLQRGRELYRPPAPEKLDPGAGRGPSALDNPVDV